MEYVVLYRLFYRKQPAHIKTFTVICKCSKCRRVALLWHIPVLRSRIRLCISANRSLHMTFHLVCMRLVRSTILNTW